MKNCEICKDSYSGNSCGNCGYQYLNDRKIDYLLTNFDRYKDAEAEKYDKIVISHFIIDIILITIMMMAWGKPAESIFLNRALIIIIYAVLSLFVFFEFLFDYAPTRLLGFRGSSEVKKRLSGPYTLRDKVEKHINRNLHVKNQTLDEFIEFVDYLKYKTKRYQKILFLGSALVYIVATVALFNLINNMNNVTQYEDILFVCLILRLILTILDVMKISFIRNQVLLDNIKNNDYKLTCFVLEDFQRWKSELVHRNQTTISN